MHVVRANLDRYLFDIYQKEGVLEEPVNRTDPGLPDDIFFSKTQDMLAAMGVFEEEAEKHEVWRLMRASRPTKINGELLDPALEDKVTVQPVMKKASFYREVGGIPVLGNRLTFSFTLDGRFLSASGRWPVLDYASSQVAADMQEPEFTNLMLNRVFESGISSEEAESIYLRTFYRAEKGSNGKHFLNMYGGAIVLREGIEGRDRKMEIEEDI